MLECGDKIGDYTLARFLGRGQFGEVWLAEKDVQFSTRKFQHALKFLFKREDEINLKTVEAEIDTWIEASGHPNVMSVLDMIVHKDYIIIASEYAEGGSLKKWLNKHAGKAPSNEKALEMMTGILRGIEHLHSRNVVHRDLKPDNILLQGDFPRITDFGISRIVSAGSLSTVAMGSPFYMSPESFDGSKSTQTDIWSAGVILYEMLTGEHPYHSETIYGLVHAIKQDTPKPLPNDISPTLRRIVETALEKDLARRYPTAKTMRAAIERELHRLKINTDSLHDFRKPELLQDLSLITFKEIDLGGGDNKLQAPKKGKETHKTNVKDTLKRQPGESVLEDQSFKAESSPEAAPTLGWSHKTVTSNFGKQLELQNPNAAPQTAEESASSGLSFTDSGFGNSQKTPAKRPWLLAAAVAVLLALGLGGGLAGLIAVQKYLNTPAPNSDAAVANPIPGSPKSNESKPTPEGMVVVPGGTFKMGRDGKILEEMPAHVVTVASFYMDKHEVTNEEYAKFVKHKSHKAPAGWTNSTFGKGKEKFPVVGVDWNDATAYCGSTGKRLPSEREWEFGARGTDGRLYPWGNEWSRREANVNRKTLKRVGSFLCNSPFKVCDLIGNAWEWTASDFIAYPNGVLPGEYEGMTNLKTIRGGTYLADKEFGTTTYRVGWSATEASTYERTGFRCVKDVEN